MEPRHLDLDRVTVPRWTIRRDPRSRNCPTCGSIIVRIKADAKRMSFCACRLVEYRVIPKAKKADE